MDSLLVRGGILVTMREGDQPRRGDLLVRDGRIVALGGELTAPPGVPVLDGRGRAVLPGLVQAHVHLNQTLFRGAADDLELLPWLRERIWPLEAAHDADSVYWAALLACAELLRGGTTWVASMETVHHTQAVLAAVEHAGLGAVVGKALMDRGEGVPKGLLQDPQEAVAEAAALHDAWNGRGGGRLRVAFCPRFALSCSSELFALVREAAACRGALVHTHAAENRRETALVRRLTGMGNVAYLDSLGLTGPRLMVAHAVHLEEAEVGLLARTDTRVVHCPTANLKLGSGIAPVAGLLDAGVTVALGADGAPCNNNLDAWAELRLAALLQKVAVGPAALPARRALPLVAREGARALGLAEEMGTLEPGKRGDLCLVELEGVHQEPAGDEWSRLVYATRAADVVATVVGGEVLCLGGQLTRLDERRIRREARRAFRRVAVRARMGS